METYSISTWTISGDSPYIECIERDCDGCLYEYCVTDDSERRHYSETSESSLPEDIAMDILAIINAKYGLECADVDNELAYLFYYLRDMVVYPRFANEQETQQFVSELSDEDKSWRANDIAEQLGL